MEKRRKMDLVVCIMCFVLAAFLLGVLIFNSSCTWVSHTKGGTTVKGLSMDSPAEFVAVTTQAQSDATEQESINYVREKCADSKKGENGCTALALSVYDGYGYGGYGYGMPGVPFGATWVSNQAYSGSQSNNAQLKQEVEALKKKQRLDDAIHERIKQRFPQR